MLALLLAPILTLAPFNVRCPVTGRPLVNTRLHHFVTLEGRRYYVFDQEAARRLRSCPTCYLAADGTPRNAALPPDGGEGRLSSAPPAP